MLKPTSIARMAAKATQMSTVVPAMIRFLGPVFSTTATTLGSSHALMMPGRMISGACGCILTISGMNGPFAPWLQLVVRTVCRLKIEDLADLRKGQHDVAKLRRRIVVHQLHDPRLV